MSATSNRLRAQITISSIQSQAVRPYSPLEGCLYREVSEPFYDSRRERQFTLSIKSVADRLLVVDRDHSQNVSSYLISKGGRLYDFNFVDDSRSARVHSDNYDAFARNKLSEVAGKRDPRYPNIYMINTFALLIPEYTTTFMNLGETVAVVRSEHGAVWGEYKFRGVTLLNNVPAAVLDLIRVQSTSPSFRATIDGFSIVDLATMMPLVAVFDSGSRYQAQRISCHK